MASVPNMRAAPTPIPAGKPPAAAAADPAGFATQLAGVPLELVRIAAETLSGNEGGDAAASGVPSEDKDEATADDAAAPSDAAQLASLVPVLQPLPAILPAAALAPPVAATPAPAAEAEPKAQAVAATAPPPEPATLPAMPAPGGKLARVKPVTEAEVEAESDQAASDAGGRHKIPTLDAAAKQAIAAAKSALDSAVRLGGSAIPGTASKLAEPLARLAVSALETVKDARTAAAGLDVANPVTDGNVSTAFAAQTASAPAFASPSSRETIAPAPDRILDLANDSQWLDRLARDIAQSSGNEGAIRFRLHPQTLGSLHVELSQSEHGTSIRLTADTEQARAILADAQPRLAAEARAQGVRIAETHVDLSGSDRQASGDPRWQDDNIPLIRTARDAAADADAPERPGRTRSDRYA